jgi:CTP:molybdopterin cytidylyltransferase MocA
VTPAGLILAAGESLRMGSPKALLEYRGETFLDRLIGLFAARCSPVVVVLGSGAAGIRARISRPALVVVNPDFSRGQTSSMQCGLRSVGDASGVLFTLVDHPAVEPRTIDALLEGSPSALLRVPRHQGRRGHPVWFSAALIPEFLMLPPSGAARDVVYAHRDETEFLDVEDAGILANIDDPAAYRELTGAEA